MIATRKNDIVIGGSRRFAQVREVKSDLLEAYALAKSAEVRINRGSATPRDEAAVLAIPNLESLVRQEIGKESLVVQHGGIGICFNVEDDVIHHFGYVNKDF